MYTVYSILRIPPLWAVCILLVINADYSLGQRYRLEKIRPFAADSARYEFYLHSSDGKKVLFVEGKPETLFRMEKGRPETKEAVASFEKILGYHWSPKGDRILYGIKIVNIEGLYWYDIKSNSSKLLTSGSYIFGNCLWDSTGIIRLHMAGKGTVTKYFNVHGNQVPTASTPYVLFRPDSARRFYRINDDGTGKTYLDNDSYGMFAVSPDRQKAAVTRGDSCYILKLYSNKRTELAQNVSSVAWSPDGRRIMFVRYIKNPENQEYGPVGSNIFIIDSDGPNETRLTYRPKAIYTDPAFSHDGRKVSFYSGKDKKMYLADLVVRE